MKVLVFDDNQAHRDAAKAQLKDHNLTIVGTYDEARDLLTPGIDQSKVAALLAERLGPDYQNLKNSKDEQDRKKYYDAERVAQQESVTYPDFDVVLTDLLVPASRKSQGPYGADFIGKEMPVGIFIGLLAAAVGRIKFVAVFTDTNHHDHPASACFDVFNAHETEPTPFMVGDCKVLLCNNRNWVSWFSPSDLTKELKYEEYSSRGVEKVRAKDWSSLLAYLIEGK